MPHRRAFICFSELLLILVLFDSLIGSTYQYHHVNFNQIEQVNHSPTSSLAWIIPQNNDLISIYDICWMNYYSLVIEVLILDNFLYLEIVHFVLNNIQTYFKETLCWLLALVCTICYDWMNNYCQINHPSTRLVTFHLFYTSHKAFICYYFELLPP